MPRGKPLLWLEEAPPCLQYNRYVHSGYRAGYTRRECLCSILEYHNETGNIWSHLLPALLLVGAFCHGSLRPWPEARFLFTSTLLPILLCFMGSVTYHTLMAHHSQYRLYLTMDVCGIFVLLLSSAPVTLWLAFMGWPTLQALFLVAYYCTAVVCVYNGLTATKSTQRAWPMFVLLLVRLTAFGTRAIIRTGSMSALINFGLSEVMSVTGAVINVLRFPEKWCQPGRKRQPGLFDYWGNSHQLMHYFTMGALWLYYRGACQEYQHWAQIKS